ncbi:MAG TPA: XRE family transcriptional regulator [Caulobacteraceae bacterium]
MTGRHKFTDLLEKMSPERRTRVGAIAQGLREEMNLTQLRAAHQLSQAALGELLHVEQPAVAKLEKRTDMYVSSLRRYIEAVGGELQIIARFPDHDVRISNFQDLGDPAA